MARHLVRRFFEVLRPTPLTPREQSEVAALVDPALASLFWGQAPADQRHGLTVARRVLRARPGDRRLAGAALLHDVGKRHSGLGAIGRSLATVARYLHLARTPRMQRYLDHGPLGAEDLAAAGADDLTVAFARFHTDGTPPGIDPATWSLLLDADHT